jgi:hypothetical protein
MQFALLIYESPEAFAARKSDGAGPYTAALARVPQGPRRVRRLRRGPSTGGTRNRDYNNN